MNAIEEARAVTTGPSLRTLTVSLGAVSIVALVVAMVALSWFALTAVERQLQPVIQSKALTLARSIAADLERAGELQIPLSGLRGVDEFFASAIGDHPETAYVALTDTTGVIRFKSVATHGPGIPVASALAATSRAAQPTFTEFDRVMDLTYPMISAGERIGTLHVGVDLTYVRDTMGAILADIGISLFVAVLIGLEVTLLVMSLSVARATGLMQQLIGLVGRGDFSVRAEWRARDEFGRVLEGLNRVNAEISGRWADIQGRVAVLTGDAAERLRERLGRIGSTRSFGAGGALSVLRASKASDIQFPLFFYIFGVELSRSFFPLYVKTLYEPVAGIDPSIAIALPMSVWVVAMLFTTPLAPGMIRRWGAREALLLGMVPTSIGLVLTAYSGNFFELIAWRCVTAAGFGMVTAAALVHIANVAPEERRAVSLGVFVTATGGGSVCGTAIGGILAERIGYADTFLVGATIVFVAMVILMGFLSPGEGAGARDLPAANPAAATSGAAAPPRRFGAYSSARFLAFMAFSAVPSRVMLTGFLFFIVPLQLDAAGYDRAAIGRVMMTYFIVLLLMNQVSSWMADRYSRHGLLIIVGGLCVGGGALVFSMTADVWPLVGGVALVGFGQSLVMTPQLAVIPDFFSREVGRYGRGAMLGAFRVLERIGSIGGPLLAGVIVASVGLSEASRLLGLGVVATTVALLLLMMAGVLRRQK